MCRMLRNTFLHIPGIGEKTERRLWENGIYQWKDFLEGCEVPGLGENKMDKVSEYIEKSRRSLEEGKFRFLIKTLPSNIHWRTYREMKERGKCCFLDIETTGLSQNYHDITMIGVYDGSDEKMFIRGKNLDEFRSAVRNYDLFVTYNGKCFDLPFIQSKFPDLNLEKFHADLRYLMKGLGYTGGLKSIEKQLGIHRSKGVQGMGGREAVVLWKKYQRGHPKALQKLIDYNREDIINLENIMHFTYTRLRNKTLAPDNQRTEKKDKAL